MTLSTVDPSPSVLVPSGKLRTDQVPKLVRAVGESLVQVIKNHPPWWSNLVVKFQCFHHRDLSLISSQEMKLFNTYLHLLFPQLVLHHAQMGFGYYVKLKRPQNRA